MRKGQEPLVHRGRDYVISRGAGSDWARQEKKPFDSSGKELKVRTRYRAVYYTPSAALSLSRWLGMLIIIYVILI